MPEQEMVLLTAMREELYAEALKEEIRATQTVLDQAEFLDSSGPQRET